MLRKVDVAASWARAKAEFAALRAERDELRRELAEIVRERDAVLARERELIACYYERQKAAVAFASLDRERRIERARRAERDPALSLH